VLQRQSRTCGNISQGYDGKENRSENEIWLYEKDVDGKQTKIGRLGWADGNGT